MDSTEAPASMATELATFMIIAFRYFLGFLRWGFVSIERFLFHLDSTLIQLYAMGFLLTTTT